MTGSAAEAATDAIKNTMDQASANGPVVFVAVVFLIVFILFLGGGAYCYFMYVLKPDRDSRRKIEESNAAATAQMALTIAAMGDVVTESHQNGQTTMQSAKRAVLLLEQVFHVHGQTLPIFQALAKKLDLSIDSDLARLSGALTEVQLLGKSLEDQAFMHQQDILSHKDRSVTSKKST